MGVHKEVLPEAPGELSFNARVRQLITLLAEKMYGYAPPIERDMTPMLNQLHGMITLLPDEKVDTFRQREHELKVASNLLETLSRKHNPEVTLKRATDVIGMLLQIDNLTSVLVNPDKLPAPDASVLRNIQVNARFEVSSGGITGTTMADVKRIEFEDDGSLTVVIDHWPIEPKVFP